MIKIKKEADGREMVALDDIAEDVLQMLIIIASFTKDDTEGEILLKKWQKKYKPFQERIKEARG